MLQNHPAKRSWDRKWQLLVLFGNLRDRGTGDMSISYKKTQGRDWAINNIPFTLSPEVWFSFCTRWIVPEPKKAWLVQVLSPVPDTQNYSTQNHGANTLEQIYLQDWRGWERQNQVSALLPEVLADRPCFCSHHKRKIFLSVVHCKLCSSCLFKLLSWQRIRPATLRLAWSWSARPPKA